MSKLLKSKFLLGVMVVAVMLVGVVAVSANTASAANCTITGTLRVGSKGASVQCLQAAVGVTADGSFGPKTKVAVVAWQKSVGLTADGVFGPKSLAALMAGGSVSTSTGSSGCQAGWSFNPATGKACTGTPVVSNTGPVSVTLASDNPAAGTLIGGQATADLAHFAFTGSGVVNSITLQRTGVSNNTVFDSVYLYQGNTRVTEAASVNNSGQITFNALNWAVNGLGVLSVRADINSGASSETVGVTLTGFTTGAGVMTANVPGNVMNVVSGTGIVGGITLSANTTGSTASVNAGTTQYTFWSAPVNVTTHNMLLSSFALHYIGSAPNDALANISLYIDGTKVATSTGPNPLGYLVFDFGSTPFSVASGSHTFDVRADVVKGSSRTVQLSLQNRADLMMKDVQANVNVGISSFSTNSGATVTISTGTVSVNIDPAFQSMTNVTGGATNALIASYKLHAYGEDVKVNTLYVTPTLAGQSVVAAAGLNNVSLYFCTTTTNCSQIGSSQNMTSATTQLLTFNLGSSLIVPAGVDSWLQVRADLTTYSTNLSYQNGTIAVALTNSGNATSGAIASNNNGQGMNSLDSTIDVPGSVQATSGLTVQTGLIAIATNVSLGTTSISPNTQHARIGSFIVQNQSTSEGVHVTNLQVGLTVTTADSTNYSNLVTSETSGSGAMPINPAYAASTGTSVNNFPVDFVLAPGTTKTLDVFADVGSASTGTLVTKLLLTATGSSSNSAICNGSLNTGLVDGCNHNGATATGQTINVQSPTFNNGGIVTSNGTTTQAQYVAGGSTGVANGSQAYYNFKSTNGVTTITELKFLVTSSSGSTVSTVHVGNSSASVVSGVAYLTGLNIAVPSTGSGVNVPVQFDYAPVGNNQSGVSGAESFVELTYVRYQVGNTTATLLGGQALAASNTNLGTITSLTTGAVGSTASMTMASTAVASQFQPGMLIAIDSPATSIVEVTQPNNGVVVTVQTLFGGAINQATKVAYFYSIPENPAYASTVNNCSMTMSDAGITVAVGGTSGTDCMSVVGSKPELAVVTPSNSLANGLVKIGTVTVHANTAGDVSINALPLSVTTSGSVTISGITVKTGSQVVPTTDNTLSAGTNTNDTVTVTFTGGYTITAGQTATFDLYTTASSAAGGGGDSIVTSLGSAGSFTWTDLAGNGGSAAETGTLIVNYPIDTSTIHD